MLKKFSRILLLVLLVFTSVAVSAKDESVFGRRDTYYKVLKKFTRKGTKLALGYLDTNFIWYATYKSEAFRRQFEDYFHRLYPEGQDGLATSSAKPWMEPSDKVEFFVAIFSPAAALQELSGTQSLWDLTLQVEGQVLKPVAIQSLEAGPFEFKFFPYLEKWYRTYRVEFPGETRVASGQPFSLVITSVAGRNELKF
jgi:hypothetical protein